MQVDVEDEEQHDELEKTCCDNGRKATGFPVTLKIRENMEYYFHIFRTRKLREFENERKLKRIGTVV